jgi:hypothetical protein
MTKKISIFFVVLAICLSAGGQDLVAESYHSDIGEITDLLNRWAYFRDHGMWDQLRTTFWREGMISISWFEGPFEEFVDECIKMDEKDTSKLLKHVIATPSVIVNGTRAVSEVNVIIYNRSSIRGLDVDMTSFIRFYDMLEKRNNSWRIAKRTAIYEKDRIDTVQPSFLFWFASLFIDYEKYPKPYRYLGYGLEKSGYKLSKNIIVNNSEKSKLLYKAGGAWLEDK